MREMPVPKDIINEYLNRCNELDWFFEEITERIDYIIECIYLESGIDDASCIEWAYKTNSPNYENVILLGEMISKGWLNIVPGDCNKPVLMTTSNGDEIDLCNDGFPASWLTEPFEDELRDGVRKSREKERWTNEKLKLVEDIKSKLTEQELNTLKAYIKEYNTI